MSRFEAALFTEFVQESLELLAELGTACGELSSSTEPNAQLATIDRGLHTIKGNAAALGFMQLSAAASKVLQAVRSEGGGGMPSAGCLGRIWRFLVECRQYLLLVSSEKTPEGGFFTSADDELSFASEIPISAPATAIVLEADEMSVEDILATVPELNPDIRRLIAGAEAPARLEAELLKPPQPVAEESERSDLDIPERAAAHAGTLAEFRAIATSAGVDGDALIEIEKFLRELGGEEALADRPIDEFLQGVIRDTQELGDALNLKINADLETSELRVLPALGHLLRHLLTELVHLRLVHMSQADEKIDWQIQATRAGDRIEIRLIGLSGRSRSSALDRVRMQSSLEFLEDLDGNVRTDKNSLVLSLSVSGLESRQCCVIQSPDGRFCLPAECVRATETDPHEPGTRIVLDGDSGETRLQVDSVAPGQEMLVVASEGELADDGILGFALSFAHSERIPLLSPDSI